MSRFFTDGRVQAFMKIRRTREGEYSVIVSGEKILSKYHGVNYIGT